MWVTLLNFFLLILKTEHRELPFLKYLLVWKQRRISNYIKQHGDSSDKPTQVFSKCLRPKNLCKSVSFKKVEFLEEMSSVTDTVTGRALGFVPICCYTAYSNLVFQGVMSIYCHLTHSQGLLMRRWERDTKENLRYTEMMPKVNP